VSSSLAIQIARSPLRFDFADAAVFPDDEGQAEFAVFGAEVFVDALKGAFETFYHGHLAGFLCGQDTRGLGFDFAGSGLFPLGGFKPRFDVADFAVSFHNHGHIQLTVFFPHSPDGTAETLQGEFT
jgi:hypothetical protein